MFVVSPDVENYMTLAEARDTGLHARALLSARAALRAREPVPDAIAGRGVGFQLIQGTRVMPLRS